MMIWRRKRYTIAVVSLLTLVFIGVGTVLGILATSVLRPLPFARPAELSRAMPFYNGGLDLWTREEFHRTASLVNEIAEVSAMTTGEPYPVEFGSDTATAVGIITEPNYFRTLGIPTGAYGAPGAAIISAGLLRKLGIDRSTAIGKSLRVGDNQLTVIAVIDRNRAIPVNGDIWFVGDQAGANWMGVVRAKPGIAFETIGDRMSRAYRTIKGQDAGNVRVMVTSFAGMARSQMAGAQRMLVAGIAMFAIIAILNYGLLGIGDARRRAQEFAVRVAVGGTRSQVMWALFRDQVLLVGIALVIAGAVLIPIALRIYDATELWNSALHADPQIHLALVGALALLVVAAALPTRVSTNTPEIEVLRRVNARASRVEAIWNRTFVSVQFGVTAFLVIVGTVALLGVFRDRATRYGFDEHNAVAGRWWGSGSRRLDSGYAATVARDVVNQVKTAFPGRVTTWGLTYRAMSGAKYKFAADPEAPANFTRNPWVWMSEDVDPAFFDVVGIRIVRGRAFAASDDAGAAPVAILTEKAARNLWGTTDVIGNRIRFGEDDGQWRTIVGVAANSYPIDYGAYAWQARGSPWAMSFAYRPLAQTPTRSSFAVIVRTRNATAVTATLQRLLERTAPGQKFNSLAPLAQYMDWRGEVASGESTSRILFAFAVCGLLLGLVGAMVLIDDVVRSRTTEFGIRRALGAPARNLISLASRETVLAGVVGIVVGGSVGARFGPIVTVWLRASLVGRFAPPSPPSWPVLGALIAGLVVILVGGTMIRAYRAARLDPAAALRIT